MFGAPDIPRRSPAPAQRRPGVGNHVCYLGGYLGLIVDILPEGRVMTARRHASGRLGVLEDDMPLASLTISLTIPLGFDEVEDREWRRGSLG